MTDGIKIRQAGSGDESGVRDCAVAAYQPYVAAIGRRPAPMEADFAALIAAGQVHVAADRSGRVLGFIVFYSASDGMLLENVAVAPEAAGQGIGARLIAFCEAEARRIGAAAVRLYTNAKMVENLSIYPHLGYAQTGRVHEDGFDRVYFEKRLPRAPSEKPEDDPG